MGGKSLIRAKAPRVIGLTGTIGSGKSRVARYLCEKGGFVPLDADQECRELLAPGALGWKGLHRLLGDEYFLAGGLLDRPKLRRAIFENPQLKRKVEHLLHPLVRSRIREKVEEIVASGGSVLVEVPLLFEAGWQEDFDLVVAVFADRETCIARLMNRDRINREEAEAALASQMDGREKARSADMEIDNSGTWEETVRRLDHILERLKR